MVSTAHIAAGGHVGDDESMARSVAACLRHGTRIGCHPSYEDREGFGRRRVEVDPHVVATQVATQVARLDAIARAQGGQVASIKPHGQLYHDLAADEVLLDAVLDVLDDEILLVLSATAPATARLAARSGRVVAEGFCDRRYRADGTLVERSQEGAVLDDPGLAVAQTLRLVQEGLTSHGRVISIDSLCVHSDSPGALATLQAVAAALVDAGVEVAPVPIDR